MTTRGAITRCARRRRARSERQVWRTVGRPVFLLASVSPRRGSVFRIDCRATGVTMRCATIAIWFAQAGLVAQAGGCSGSGRASDTTETGATQVPQPPTGIDRECIQDDDCDDGLACVIDAGSAGWKLNTCQVPCPPSRECQRYACFNCVDDATPAFCLLVGCS